MCKEINFRVIAAGFYLCNDNNLEEALVLLDEAAEKGEFQIPNEVIILDKYELEPLENIVSYIDDLETLLQSTYNKGVEAGKKLTVYTTEYVTNKFKCTDEQANEVLKIALEGEWLNGEIKASINIVARELGYKEIFKAYDKNNDEIEVGDIVDVDAPKRGDMHNFDFQGTVKAIGENYVTVEDQEGDCFDIEPCSLEVVNE